MDRKIIPKGTLIKIGTKHVRHIAIGVIFETTRDTFHGDRVLGNIIGRGNGWEHDQISHKVNVEVDTIIPKSNKAASNALQKAVD